MSCPPSRRPESLELAHDASRGLKIESYMLEAEQNGQNFAPCLRYEAPFQRS